MKGKQTVVDVSRRTRLPDVCIQCGESTHRQVRVKVVGPRPPVLAEPKPVWGSALGCLPGFGLLFWLASLFDTALNPREPPAPVIALRVPQCAVCAREGKPKPLSADFGHGFLRFEASPRFLDWKEQAARRPSRVEAPPRGSERGT